VAVDEASGDAVVAARFRPSASRVSFDGATRWHTSGLAHSPSAIAVAVVGERGIAVVGTHLGSRLEVLDVETGEHLDSIAVEFLSTGIAVLDGMVYVASRGIAVIDAGSRHVVAEHTLPSGATSCTASERAVWVGCADTVVRVDTAGATSVAREPGPHTVGADASAPTVWVADHRRGRCDLLADDASVISSVKVDGNPWCIAAHGQRAFVALPERNRIAVIDADRVVDELAISRPWSLSYDAKRDRLWVASPLDGVVHALDVS
jgi:DNA-binding beta-propeller fold protein YncE